MRLLLDENLASKELIRRLSGAGHEVLPPILGASDDEVWARAQAEQAVVVTINAVDFRSLSTATEGHAGLMIVYREGDPRRDMTAAAVADAIGVVAETYPGGPGGMVLGLNSFRR